MRLRDILLFGLLVTIAFTSKSLAHCEAAYLAGPKIAYQVRSIEAIQARKSYNTAVQEVEKTFQQKTGAVRAAPFAAMTSAQIIASLPTLARSSELSDISRQNALTYWLIYVRKLYEEERYKSVLDAISELHTSGLLKNADILGGYDDGDIQVEAYFSIPTLTRIFRAYEEPAKLALLSSTGFGSEYRQTLQSTIQTQSMTFNFEAPRSALRGVTLEEQADAFLPKVADSALAPAADFARARASEAKWDRITNLGEYDEILGVSDDVPDQISMYVSVGSGVGSLTITSDGEFELTAGLDCRNDFERSLISIAQKLPKDRGRIALGALVKAGDRYVLTVYPTGHIYITEDELRQLMDGSPVAGKDAVEHYGGFQRVINDLIKSKATLVLWSHPMMQKKGPARDATIRFAHALSRAYPDLNVVIDDPNPRVPEIARNLAELSIAPKDVYVVVDRQYSVKFQGELSDSAGDMRKLVGANNVIFIDGSEVELPPSTNERAVIVITGHSDNALEAFIDHLAAKGYLKNNFVVLQSCGNELSPRLVAKINGKYGAAGTFHYPENILEKDAVEHTKEILQSVVVGGSPFGQIVRARAAKPAKPWERAMNGAWTICRARNLLQSRNG